MFLIWSDRKIAFAELNLYSSSNWKSALELSRKWRIMLYNWERDFVTYDVNVIFPSSKFFNAKKYIRTHPKRNWAYPNNTHTVPRKI